VEVISMKKIENIDDLINGIKNRLKKLSSEQKAKFTWLCAIRALPFLGAKSNFSYWEEENKQIMLLSVFRAIDISAYALYAADAADAAYAAYAAKAAADAAADAAAKAAANAVANAVAKVAYTNYDTAYVAAKVAVKVAYAAKVTAKVADAAYDVAKAAYDVAEAACDAAEAAYLVYAAYAAKAAYASWADCISIDVRDVPGNAAEAAYTANCDFNKSKFYKLLCSDINKIYENKNNDFDNGFVIYGGIWQKFLDELKAIGCGYWANLYMDLFNNQFKINKEKLELRINVPMEILEKGASAVGEWLENLESQGTQHLNEARIIILGEKGVGKTSLANKLHDIDAKLPKLDESTEGVDVSVWNLPENNNGSSVNAHIWDFAGHVVTHSAHKFFLSERCLYILVYNGRSGRRNFLEYWLNHVIYYGGDSPVFILVNKQDESSVDIDENGLSDKYQCIQDFDYLSLKDDRQKLITFKEKIEKYIKNNPAWNKGMPKFWFDVKEQLRKKFSDSDNTIDFIPPEEFAIIAKDSGVIEEKNIEEMRNALHSLGVCLYYKQIKQLDTYILNPNWITNGIYKIINWLSAAKQDYKVMFSDLETIFIDNLGKYPKDKQELLFKLLILYDLAYPYKTEEDGEALVLPALLSEKQPYRNMENDFPVSQSLYMRYKADTELPPDTISRFIVQHHREIMSMGGEQIVWRRGVKLGDGAGNTALVVEDIYTREIKVCVKGPEHIVYLDKLRNTLNTIFESYKSNYPTLEYAVEIAGKIVYISDKKILVYTQNNQLYLDENTGKSIDLQNSKDKYNITFNVNGNIETFSPEIKITDQTNFTINLRDCILPLQKFQGELVNLAKDLKKAGYNEDAENINEIAEISDEIENLIENGATNEDIEKNLNKKGWLSKINKFVAMIRTFFVKFVQLSKNVLETLQNILKLYNSIAKFFPQFPQIPGE
jgi:GTPase SAR1 family protein